LRARLHSVAPEPRSRGRCRSQRWRGRPRGLCGRAGGDEPRRHVRRGSHRRAAGVGAHGRRRGGSKARRDLGRRGGGVSRVEERTQPRGERARSRGGHLVLRAGERPRCGSALRRAARRRRRDRALARRRITRLGGDERRGEGSTLDAVIVNRHPKVRGPYTAFAEVAGAYERGRPGYPEEAVRWLVGDEPSDVVDLGAGTGKLTRSLVALGHRGTEVEPLDEMRALLASVLPDVRALEGSDAAIPLPEGSAHVVVSAQAFHWFDHDDALPDIARVLRPGGHIALVWNSRDDRDPWMAP